MAQSVEQYALLLVHASTEPDHPTRFTQDFPFQSNVWMEIANGDPQRALDVLMTPNVIGGVPQLVLALDKLDLLTSPQARLGIAESHIVACATIYELFGLLPLTDWWQRNYFDRLPVETLYETLAFQDDFSTAGHALYDAVREVRDDPGAFRNLARRTAAAVAQRLAAMAGPASSGASLNLPSLVEALLLGAALEFLGDILSESGDRQAVAMQLTLLMKELAGSLIHTVDRLGSYLRPSEMELADSSDASRADDPAGLAASMGRKPELFVSGQGPLWSVTVNRRAEHAVYHGRCTIKADAALRVFEIDTSRICWAILDSGIDARHPAFLRDMDLLKVCSAGSTDADTRFLVESRVAATYDFTRLRDLTAGSMPKVLEKALPLKRPEVAAELHRQLGTLARDLRAGRLIDWAAVEPWLEIPHTPAGYIAPVNGHGTHVAGILGANWRREDYERHALDVPGELVDEDVVGICPGIQLIDLRVFDEKGNADEFALLGALQYLRYRNRSRDKHAIHGVNISLSLVHDVQNYGCGGTPICQEVDRLAVTGVVVVTAAGNFGFERSVTLQFGGSYRGVTITDPGNAVKAITVGSTHRVSPHSWGVSYFSSRGPTGDGRAKPDLVAPGEKIRSVIPDMRVDERDGTSMAAPCVSGAAALLMARHEELIGDPDRVKQILCGSATDLGRERHFQGAGLVDALRALQSV